MKTSLIAICLTALICFSCGKKKEETTTTTTETKTTTTNTNTTTTQTKVDTVVKEVFIFESKTDTSVSVSYEGNTAHVNVMVGGKTVQHYDLPIAESGSGAKYSNGKVTLWTKGDEGTFETPSGSMNITLKK